MSTRWKRENPESLILMHAHNQFSNWYGYLLSAADELGVPVCYSEYQNCSGDGSWDREWTVPHGTRKAIIGLAEKNRMLAFNSKE